MRILVLDDDAEYGQMIADFLRRNVPEYVTLAVATANETRAAARDADQPYDVLLIDQRLDAGQDGIQPMQDCALRAQTPTRLFSRHLMIPTADCAPITPEPINICPSRSIPVSAVDSTFPARGAHGRAERRWLRTLTEIAEAAQRALSVTAVADILTQGGLRLGFERARLWQLDAERQLLVGISQAGDNGFPHFDGLRMPVAESPYCSRALQSAEPMVFRERELGPGYLEAVLAVGQFRLQRGEWVDIPLWVGDRCWVSWRWITSSGRSLCVPTIATSCVCTAARRQRPWSARACSNWRNASARNWRY